MLAADFPKTQAEKNLYSVICDCVSLCQRNSSRMEDSENQVKKEET